MTNYNLVFVTERSQRHQQAALAAAPECLNVKMLVNPDRNELIESLAEADYLISERVGEIDANLIQAAPKLKLIQRLGSLTYDIDLNAAQQAGIEVCYLPIESVINVAEHLVLQMLALGKRVVEAQQVINTKIPDSRQSNKTTADMFAYNWSGMNNLQGITGKTVGILGFGQIGAELSSRLRGWNCKILYNKRRPLPEDVEKMLGITYAEREDLTAQSDYICNLLPYNKSTHLSLNATFFEQMKQGAYFISCGAGSVIDFDALAHKVESGWLAGVAVDSFDIEPPKSSHPLISSIEKSYNVFLTPHIAAGNTQDPVEKRKQDYNNILNYICNRPRNCIIVKGAKNK